MPFVLSWNEKTTLSQPIFTSSSNSLLLRKASIATSPNPTLHRYFSDLVAHKAAVLLLQFVLYLATCLASVHVFHPSSCSMVSPGCFGATHFKYQHQQQLITLFFNPCVLKFHIRLSRHILYACIDLRDSQSTSLRNFRICWKIWQLYIKNFLFLVILIFSWINVQQ